MSRADREESIRPAFRRLVEEYTPDGTLGRLGLGAVTAVVGTYGMILSVGFFLNPALASWLIVPTAGAAGVVLALVTVLTVWPVYLAAIGRIDSPAEYADELRTRPSPSPSPVERLKAEYQRGTLSEEAFEREVEAVLDESDRSPSETGRDRQPHDDRSEELERTS